MSLKGMCFKAGGYARRNDPHRREYYNTQPSSNLGPHSSPATSSRDAVGGIFVTLFMVGSLLTLVFPPLGAVVIVFSLVCGGTVMLASALIGGVLSCFNRPARPVQDVEAPPAAPQQPESPGYLVCTCNHCDQKLEFPDYGVGTEIQCPTCGLSTVLYEPAKR